MKKIYLFALFCVIALGVKAQGTYNKALADSLGADEYGMKMYTLVILKTGENKTTDKAKIDSAFKGHMANIGKLAANGKLVVAGPMGKNDKGYRGIFIFNVKTVAEAQELLKSDPAVQTKILEAEIYPWYGSAALPVYLETHKKIEKTSH
ncbi:MAG: YciI family protein [Bacteroidota bacterium]